MTNDQNKKIFFSGEKNPFDIILEILEKNNLKETRGESMNKMNQGKISRIKVLYELSKGFAEKRILEKDFILSVQKQLEITSANAQNITKDIKEKILPLAKKDNADEQKTREKITPIAPPRPTEKMRKNILEKQEIKEVKNISRTGPDNYREPIG